MHSSDHGLYRDDLARDYRVSDQYLGPLLLLNFTKATLDLQSVLGHTSHSRIELMPPEDCILVLPLQGFPPWTRRFPYNYCVLDNPSASLKLVPGL